MEPIEESGDSFAGDMFVGAGGAEFGAGDAGAWAARRRRESSGGLAPNCRGVASCIQKGSCRLRRRVATSGSELHCWVLGSVAAPWSRVCRIAERTRRQPLIVVDVCLHASEHRAVGRVASASDRQSYAGLDRYHAALTRVHHGARVLPGHNGDGSSTSRRHSWSAGSALIWC